MHARRGRRVIVVGAGLAGLAAADALRRSGADVVVLEAGDRVGGRVHTLRGFAGGQVAEGGGEFIDAGHMVMRGYAKRLGLTLTDLYAAGSDHPGCFYFGGRRTANRYVYGNAEDRFYAAAGAGRERSAQQVLDGLRLSPGARRWLRHETIRDDFTVEPDRLSARFAATSEEHSGGGPERLHVRGGNDQIPGGLAHGLGARVHLGATVTAIAQDDAGVTVTAGGETFRGDHCIVAAPLPALRTVSFSPALPSALAAAIARLQYGTGAKVALQYRRRHWRAQGFNGDTLTDLSISSSWEATDGQPGAAGILLVYTMGAPGEASVALTDEERIAAAASDLDQIYPGGGAPLAAQTLAWPHTYTAYAPGQYAAYHRALRTPVGRIVLAGEHVSDVTGYMEGAGPGGPPPPRLCKKMP